MSNSKPVIFDLDSQEEQVSDYCSSDKQQDPDSISLENLEFFKNLEVTEKIYSHHDNGNKRNSDDIFEIIGDEMKRTVNISDPEDDDNDLIDLCSPITYKMKISFPKGSFHTNNLKG